MSARRPVLLLILPGLGLLASARAGRTDTRAVETPKTPPPAAVASSGGAPIFRDARDGRRYPLVRIAGMTWFARNLDFAADGSFCFGAKPEDCERWGRLYPWEIAVAACPAGTHLSTDAEWKAVEKFLGMDPVELDRAKGRGAGVGDALKPGGSSGLDVLLSGWRNPKGEYREGNGNDRAAAFWTADDPRPGVAWHRDVSSARSVVWRSEVDKPYALSVRCVLDPGTRPQGRPSP